MDGDSPTPRQQCCVCGKWMPRGSTKVCSPECAHERDLRWKRESRKRAADRGSAGLPVAQCYICGKTYQPRVESQKTCGEKACRLQHNKILREMKPTITIECRICGMPVAVKQGTKTALCYREKCYHLDREAKGSGSKPGVQAPGPWYGGDFAVMSTGIPGTLWDDPIMDPMTNHMEPGVWVSVTQQKHQRKEAA